MEQRDLLATALASVANAILITDRNGLIVWANDAFCRLSGYTLDDVIGKSPSILTSGKQDADFYRRLWQTILGGKTWQGELVDRRKDGSFYTVEETITPLIDGAGNITHFIAIQHDITLRKQVEDKDHFLAYHDDLTGLPNRALFLKLLEQSIKRAQERNKLLAVLFIDLDKFKPVNDTLGHRAGDHLLVAVAERLRNSVRKSDVVARLGGDEFTVIQMDIDNVEPAQSLAKNLVHDLSQPYRVNGHVVRVGASIGISVYPLDGDDSEKLLGLADVAMYRAKGEGASRFAFYNDTLAE